MYSTNLGLFMKNSDPWGGCCHVFFFYIIMHFLVYNLLDFLVFIYELVYVMFCKI
jgi:hypothetical protein